MGECVSDRSGSAAAEVLRVPFALTRQVRGGTGLRGLRAAESGGQRTWTFDLALDRRQLGGTDRVLAYGWRRYLGGNGPLTAALGLAAQLDR